MKKFFILFFLLLLILIVFFKPKEEFNVSLDLSEKDHKFLTKCYSHKSLLEFKDYFKKANITKIYDNKEIIGMVLDTNNNIIEEIPKLTLNGTFLSHLCIDEKHRRKKLGTKMVKTIINKAKQSEKDHISLIVKQSNKKAINLYEKLGFIRFQEGYSKDMIPIIFYFKYL